METIERSECIPLTEFYGFGGKKGVVESLVTTTPKSSLTEVQDNIICPTREVLEKLIDNTIDVAECGIEITITFRPVIHDQFKPRRLLKMVNDFFNTYRKRYKSFRLYAVGEYSEVGRFHIHGILHAPEKMYNSLRRNVPKHFGLCEIKIPKYTVSYALYMFKCLYADPMLKHPSYPSEPDRFKRDIKNENIKGFLGIENLFGENRLFFNK